MKRICIVGAGTAGLCSARRSIQNHFDITVYEQTSEIGGTWVYTDQVGTDEFGLDVHSSMYQGLRTNLPKEVMGYPDFDIDGGHNESYVPSDVIKRFLEEYAEKYQLNKYIKFRHHVINITPKRNNKWQVIVKDLIVQRVYTELYDFVMVCNGHYHTPSIPKIPGDDLYKGFKMHSHDYKNTNRFKDESVLIIGAGPSGMDLCHEISKVAKRVTLSHHMIETPKTKFRSNVTQKPDVKRFDERYVHFVDGTQDDYSIIFYCTGFQYAFPFLSVDCGIHVDENWVQPLYKHCININNSTMSFIGIPFYVCAAQMCDLQARFCMKFWTKQKPLPDKETMLNDLANDMKKRLAKGLRKRQAHMMGEDQGSYYTELAEAADIEGIKPVMTALHNESSRRFLDDLLNFRDDIFRIVDNKNFIKIN